MARKLAGSGQMVLHKLTRTADMYLRGGQWMALGMEGHMGGGSGGSGRAKLKLGGVRCSG
jgi:hypothetical protein